MTIRDEWLRGDHSKIKKGLGNKSEKKFTFNNKIPYKESKKNKNLDEYMKEDSYEKPKGGKLK
ncbi:hypothetical protein CMI37_32495 [Candidatus Pacearchaeota archaeon]|nr:hypothetical protein [Candidatus Pacearchaeota archaeon]|tara:strand:- start:19208 stop:19396 length:189 start_codon:yes stop_codon:yes gene_type:complete